MKTLLTPEETILAKSQGWCLEYVFDTTKNKWMLCTLPLEIRGNTQQAMNTIVTLAKQRNALCIKALQLIHQHNLKS
jgi:hypothetical protein